MGDRGVSRAEDGLAPDRRLIVRRWGDANAPPLVFWPGLNPSAHAQLDELGPEWAEALAVRVLAVEPPGWTTPALPAEDYRPTALARRVVALLEDVGPAVFVGYSWGASIGCYVAAFARERLRALVLLDAGYTDFQDQPGFEEKSLAGLTEELRGQGYRFPSWSAFLDSIRGRYRAWRPALEQRARAGMRERDGEIVPIVAPEVVAAAAHGVVVERPSATLPRLGALDLPILIVAAQETVAQEWAQQALERFREAVPAAAVETVESSHDVLADAPRQTTAALTRWLGRLQM